VGYSETAIPIKKIVSGDQTGVQGVLSGSARINSTKVSGPGPGCFLKIRLAERVCGLG
jgi:hypothetical protein